MIGMTNSSFKNPSGLDAEGHYSTANDMARLTAYALKNPVFQEIVKTKVKKKCLIRMNPGTIPGSIKIRCYRCMKALTGSKPDIPSLPNDVLSPQQPEEGSSSLR